MEQSPSCRRTVRCITEVGRQITVLRARVIVVMVGWLGLCMWSFRLTNLYLVPIWFKSGISVYVLARPTRVARVAGNEKGREGHSRPPS